MIYLVEISLETFKGRKITTSMFPDTVWESESKKEMSFPSIYCPFPVFPFPLQFLSTIFPLIFTFLIPLFPRLQRFFSFCSYRLDANRKLSWGFERTRSLGVWYQKQTENNIWLDTPQRYELYWWWKINQDLFFYSIGKKTTQSNLIRYMRSRTPRRSPLYFLCNKIKTSNFRSEFILFLNVKVKRPFTITLSLILFVPIS